MGALAILLVPAGATAKPKHEPKLQRATYPDLTTFSCRSDAIPIHPGQNTDLWGVSKTCPNATKISGPADASIFAPGSDAEGYVTRFRPSMVEIKPDGRLVTPSVWDLHLHHAVWIAGALGGPVFGVGEEKTHIKVPQGYGLRVGAGDNWGLNYMIHALTAEDDRSVFLTWEIDWVPADQPRGDINPLRIRWMDVAGIPQIYPVFDAERGFDLDGDGKYTFPDEVPNDPAAAGFEERRKISPSHSWTVPQDLNLVQTVGHLHPGGLRVDLEVARDGPDAGEVDGDDPTEVRPLFRSDARYYEPAGAVSWDVSMEATRSDWRIALKRGDTVSIDATYDVKRASWYEAMGIMPLGISTAPDPLAKDPFEDGLAVRAMYDAGGILTHGRLPENRDRKARKNLRLADPRDLPGAGPVPSTGIEIEAFGYSPGGYSAFKGFPADLMRPPTISPGEAVTFTNLDATQDMPDLDQAWHSITSCKAPCNRGSGIGSPLARGPIKFDSGQLGFDGDEIDFSGQTSTQVTTDSNVYTTPPLTKPGKTYTYFCRIHPFMRGSVRVKDKR
jgi:plastocyanin